MSDINRRDFLKLTTSVLLTTCGVIGLDVTVRFLHSQAGSRPQTEFDLGSIQDYPVGTRTLFPEIPALLIHDDNGFSALSMVCTHLGCTVQQQGDGFICPCHGSRYDEQGSRLHGPAEKALHSLRIETTDDGHLHVFLA